MARKLADSLLFGNNLEPLVSRAFGAKADLKRAALSRHQAGGPFIKPPFH
jgi:hypothetical protein